MNLNKIYFLFLIAVLYGGILYGQQDDMPFKDGERLTYVLNYKWGAVDTDVGDAVVGISYRDGMWHSVIKGKSFKFFDVFFKVREHFESKFYDNPIRPYYFYRDTYEGKYHISNEFYFKDTLIEARIQKYDRTPVDTVLKCSSYTFDLPALFYKVRGVNFDTVAVGKKMPISFAIDTDVYNFYYIYLGREDIKIPRFGKYRALKFAVKLVAGSVFTGKDDLYVWVTDDKNKVPLLFSSPILVGTVSGRIVKWENLKYPVESKR